MAESTLQRANWVTGVILNLIGSFSINLGTNLIQYSHLLTTKYKKNAISSLKPSLIFCLAWLIFVGGNLLNFISFSYATQTVLSSLGSVQFIANIIFIYLLFKIYPTRRQISGTIFIIIGNICIVLVANKTTFKFDSQQLINLFTRTQYVSYLITIICLSIIFQVIYYYLHKQQLQSCKTTSNYRLSQSSDLDEQQQPTRRSPSIDSNPETKKYKYIYHKFHDFCVSKSALLIPTLYAFISAMIGSQSVVLAKSSSLLITESIGADSQFNDPITYIFIISWSIAMVFWLYRMNNALRKYEGVFIIPVLQVLWMLFSILSGGILFKEFDGYYWYNYIGFFIGTIIIFYGVYQLSPQKENINVNTAENVLIEPSENIILNSNEIPITSVKNYVYSRSISPEHTQELIDKNIVAENVNKLCDDFSVRLSISTITPPNVMEINSNENIHGNITPPPPLHSLSLRTIHKIFATSGRIIMKVTGADGRTHLAGPSFTYEYPYMKILRHTPTQRNISLETTNKKQKATNAKNSDLTQSLPTVMPSDLKGVFETIRLENVKKKSLQTC
eukprot:441353_1